MPKKEDTCIKCERVCNNTNSAYKFIRSLNRRGTICAGCEKSEAGVNPGFMIPEASVTVPGGTIDSHDD
jgi:hypothetical protein